MPNALESILLDLSSPLEIAIEIDSAHRTTGALKTWYYSNFPRSVDGEVFQPFVTGDVGPLSQFLAEDQQFSGLARIDPGSISLIQRVVDASDDLLSQHHDYTFAGYQCRILVGHPTYAYDDFIIYRSPIVAQDPEVATVSGVGLQSTFRLSSILSRMDREQIMLRRYAGIPTCLRSLTASTGRVTIPNHANYAGLKNFAIAGRFRQSANPSSLMVYTKRGLSSNSRNWIVQLLGVAQTDVGRVNASASVGGVATISIGNTTRYDDDLWHWYFFSVLDKTHAYLIIDNELIGTQSITGSVDDPNTSIILAQTVGTGSQDNCDHRIYNRYISPTEARSIMSARGSSTDLGTIGLHPLDDNGGASVNDESTTANNGSTSGTINVDYAWKESDLGEETIEGNQFPLALGQIYNAPADKSDFARSRFRINDGFISGIIDPTGGGLPPWHRPSLGTDLTVKSKGDVLTGGGVDYTDPALDTDAVITITPPIDEPVTFDLYPKTSGVVTPEVFFPISVAYRLLTQRTRFTNDDINVDKLNPLRILCPWPSGYFTKSQVSAASALKEILGNSGHSYYEDSLGRLDFDVFLPPFGYGPNGLPCMDFSRDGNGANFGDVADISSTSSQTICFWWKTALNTSPNLSWGSSSGLITLVGKSNVSGNYSLDYESAGEPDRGRLIYTIGGVSAKSPAGLISPFQWYFIAATFNNTTNLSKIFIGPYGGTLVEVASVANTGTPVVDSNDLILGHNTGGGSAWSCMQQVSMRNIALSISDLQTDMDVGLTGGETGTVFYAPLTEGDGAPVDLFTSTAATITAAQWAPKFTVDLNQTPSVHLSQFRHATPAFDAVIHYNRNYKPMSDAELLTSLTDAQISALKRPWLDVSDLDTDTRSIFKNAVQLEINSPLADKSSAMALLRLIKARLHPDCYIGTLDFPPGLNISRRACGLVLSDEIGIKSNLPSKLSTGRSFRVSSVSHLLSNLSSTIGFAG